MIQHTLLDIRPCIPRQEVEDRLRLLAAFLGDVLGRARARADSGRGWSALFDARGGGGRSGGLPAAKRPRVEEAAKQELQRCVQLHSRRSAVRDTA